MITKSQDNILTILKSMPKINYTFSRKNREFNKTFKNKSLETLLRILDSHPKIHDEYTPSQEFLNNRNKYEINFQNSDNYIKEFSDLNNLPLVMSNRNCLKNGTFNPDYDLNPVKSKEEQKLIILEKEKRKRERLQDRLERLKKWRESDSSLDPGKYHPNYNFIKKKITNVYIRQPIVVINKKIELEKKLKMKKKENKKEEHKNNSNNQNPDNSHIEKESNNKNIIINKNDNENKENKNNNSINFNDSNSFNSSKISIIKKIKKEPGRNIKNNLLDKNSSTISDYNNTIEINKSTNIEDLPSFNKNNKLNSVKNRHLKNFSLPTIGNKKIKNIKHIKFKKNKFRSTSLGNIKNSLFFKKMLGRDGSFFENQNLNLISYSPNYESMTPHIPATIFKYKNNNQNYKKYITGKIIRGYNYTPEKYFVFEFQKTNIKKINLNKEREKIKKILEKKISNI